MSTMYTNNYSSSTSPTVQAEGALRASEAEAKRLSAVIRLLESGVDDASGERERREEATCK